MISRSEYDSPASAEPHERVLTWIIALSLVSLAVLGVAFCVVMLT